MLTRDDVIRLAREAGIESNDGGEYPLNTDAFVADGAALERFATLVAATERKTCNVACAQAIEYAKGAERDACAELCDQFAELMRSGKAGDQLTDQLLDLQAKTGDDLAAVIRARGETSKQTPAKAGKGGV